MSTFRFHQRKRFWSTVPSPSARKTCTELLGLLDSKDHVGVVSAEALASGKVFTDEQMEQLLDRSDLAWGENPHNPANKAVSKVEGVFTVIDQDLDKKGDLGSVKE